MAWPALVLGLLVMWATSCAQRQFPPGGPEDTTAPSLVSALPDSGATGVESGTSIALLFSEKMNKRSVEGAFRLVPPADLKSLRWEKNSLQLVPAVGLLPDRTYTLFLAAGVKDARGNRTLQPVVIHFTTGDSLPPGRLEGKIFTGRLKPQGVMVWAFDSEGCPPVFGETLPDGLGQSDSRGEFSVGALKVDHSYCVYAHNDLDMNGEVDEGELVVEADSLASITSERHTVSGLEIYLVEQDEPGRISGAIVDSARIVAGLISAAPDTVWPPSESREAAWDPRQEESDDAGFIPGLERGRPASKVLVPDSAEAPPGSTDVVPGSGSMRRDSVAVVLDPAALKAARAESVYVAAPVLVMAFDRADSANVVQGGTDKGGVFTLRDVRSATYRLEVFRDLDGDKNPTPEMEPVAVIETVVVRPGRTTDVGKLILRWPESLGRDELQDRILRRSIR